ncbi:MAG: hypothetical protein ACR2MY_06265 [Candidatus Dormibacteria bacterium]
MTEEPPEPPEPPDRLTADDPPIFDFGAAAFLMLLLALGLLLMLTMVHR